MKVVILAGGYGTRLQEETTGKPKPMVEIGGLPILWHIMKIYSAQGFNEFIIALGYRGYYIKDYFLAYQHHAHDLTIRVGTGEITVYDGKSEDWIVHLVDTGQNSMTGGRIRRLEHWLKDEEAFMLTYGDGVADVDLHQLLAFHHEQGKLVTVTAVRPPGRFGGLRLNGELVEEFAEKPESSDRWISGGFFVVKPQVFSLLQDDSTIWEREPLETLASRGQLAAYRHNGFWQCMDTVRDVQLLEQIWQTGKAPWKIW